MIRIRRPPWWAIALTAAGVLLFLRLGVWQLHRAADKEALMRRYAASISAPFVDFTRVADAPPTDGFPRVRVHGHYLADRVYLLDNPGHDERGGVEVFAPLQMSGHRRVLLVDLGFLAAGGHGTKPPIPPLPGGEVSLQGSYVPPPPTGLEMGGDALARQQKWPKDSIFIDPEQIARDLGRPLYPHVLALDADSSTPYRRTHKLDFSSMPPARHRAYAWQWFSFAVAAVAILLVVNRRRDPEKSDAGRDR